MYNLNFNDDVYVTALKNMSIETVFFQTNITSMIDELTFFSESIKKFSGASLPDLANSLKGLFSALTDTKTALTGVSDGISAYKTLGEVSKAMKYLAVSHDVATASTMASTAAATANTTQSVIATVAQNLWNAAVLLFPAVALIAGIAAIVAAVAFFIKHINKASEEQKRLNAETAELKKKNEELTKSMKDSEDTYKNNTDKMAVQAGTAEKLAEKVFELSEKENKSAEEKQQLALMVDELNNAMPGLNLLYDEEADLLNKSSDAVYGLIAAKKEELLQEAMAERAVELLKEQLELEYQREEVSKKISEWENATDVKDDATEEMTEGWLVWKGVLLAV